MWFWYTESQQYGENNVMHRTYNDYAALLSDVRSMLTLHPCAHTHVHPYTETSPLILIHLFIPIHIHCMQSLPPRYLPSILVTSNECVKACGVGEAEKHAEDPEVKKLAAQLGPTRLVRPK